MSKITLTEVTSLTNESSATAAINNNSNTVVAAMDNTLSRDGSQPNAMAANLDMASNQIINLPAPSTANSPLRLSDLNTFIGGGTIVQSALPSGGTTGQFLKKNSGTNFDAVWANLTGLPTGGVANNILRKNSGTDYDASWGTTHEMPAGGSVGRVLAKLSSTDYDAGWTTIGPISQYNFAYDPKTYGAVGDGVADDFNAITNCINAARAAGGTVFLQDGTYKHSGTINWAWNRLKVVAIGANVKFKHSGTGNAHSFSGMVNYPGQQGCIGGVFGAGNRIWLEGNASTVNLVLLDNWHFGYMRISGRNTNNDIIMTQDTGIVASAAVCTTFDIEISPNMDGTAFTTTPSVGCEFNWLNVCKFDRLIVEGCGGSSRAVRFVNCTGNYVLNGSVESNSNGGIFIDSTSKRNVFISVGNEVNGTQEDWLIAGSDNELHGCYGAGTAAGNKITGSYNRIYGGDWQSMIVAAGATENWFQGINELTAYTDSGTRTTMIANRGGIATAQEYSQTTLGNKLINTANGITFRINSNTISAVSGTGATVLLSTSPVMVTPLLGTPTSGVLTNCTGLPIAGLSGLGTGVATVLGTAVSGSGAIPGEVTGTWTPTDASGAGLTFTSVNCRYTKQGNMVHAYGTLTFPSTANASVALIGGLPITVPNASYATVPGACKNSVGIAGTVVVPVANTAQFQVWNNGAAALQTNTNLTTAVLTFSLMYPAT